MAYYSIFPEKDSTIYSHPDRLTMNTGNDEILKEVCPGDFGKLNKQGFCMIGIR